MTPERWQQVERIFQSAFERDPAQRAAFLDEACTGDASLRREVESLIAAHGQAGSFIEPPTLIAPATELGNESAPSLSGQTLGPYQILSLLGRGGMGEVYLAEDSRLGRKLALKLLPAQFTQDPERVRRFQQEARAASALNHPNIITVYEIGQADNWHYIATEFVDGETLRRLLQRGKAELHSLLELLAQVADGLAKAHAAGIVHRDLKPENIMRTRDGYAKVLDFGLAKLIEPPQRVSGALADPAVAPQRQTQPGAVMGTVGYMSPEQAEGKDVDQQSDIFSFGCILYEVVTGHQPFEAASAIDVLHKIIHAPAPPVTAYQPDCPAELQHIIRKCLVKDPKRRYYSIRDVGLDLREFLEAAESESASVATQPAAQSNQVARETAEGVTPETGEFESSLSDADPKVAQTTRFTKASIALAVFGILGAIVIWPAYRRAQIGSELKLECPKVVALSKARELVKSFSYDAAGLTEHILFGPTELDLKRVAAKGGFAEARRAVREGKVAAWKIALTQPVERFPWSLSWKPKPGEFSVSIDPRGHLISFSTSPREDTEVAALEKEQAIKRVEEIVQRMFSVDLGNYEVEFIKRSNSPGVAEITWQNRNPIFSHKDLVRVNLQGTGITTVSRSLEPQFSSDLVAGKKEWLTTMNRVFRVINSLAVIATYALGLMVLITGKRWKALRRRLPIAASAIVTVSLVASLIQSVLEQGWDFDFLFFGITFSLLFGVFLFPAFAGFFEWLRVRSPARIYGAEQLVGGRLLSRPVAASLVHGVLGGALVAGITNSLMVLMAMSPGYLPSVSKVINQIQDGSSLVSILATVANLSPIFYFFIMIAVVELVERMTRRRVLHVPIPALLIAVAATDFEQDAFLAVTISLLSNLLVSVVIVQIYRSKGFAAALLAYAVSGLLNQATIARYVGDPSFVLQSNLIVFGVVLLLAAGVWGYVGARVRQKLAAAGIG